MPLNSSTNSNTRLKLLKLTFFFLFIPSVFWGQHSLTGLWTGVITNDSNTTRKDVSMEIALTEYRGKVYGYSRSEFIMNDTLYYIVKRVKGSINGDVCEVKDDEIISYNFQGKLDKGVKVIHTFKMNKQDSTWSLAGGWKTTSTKKYYSLSGKTELSEEKDLTKSKIFPHLEELNLADDVAFYKEQKRMKQVAVQTSTIIADEAGNVILTKSDINTQSKPSLTSLENSDQRDNEPKEENITIQQKKVDGSIAIIPSETKKTSLSSVNSVETKKPTITDPGKPFIEKKETAIVQPPVESKKNETQSEIIIADNKKLPPATQTQSEIKKNETSTAIIQNEIKKNVPLTANNTPIKKNELVVSSNNNSVQKNEIVSNQVQTATKKIETPVTTISPDVSKINTQTSIANANKPDPTAATFAAERKSQKTQTIFFKADSLELVLYDNGEVDGDTVSILLNNEVIIAKQCLKAVAYKKTIYIPKNIGDSTVLTLYAENLGKYPPNTGLLIVHDGDNSYPVHFTADLQTNASVMLRRKSQ